MIRKILFSAACVLLLGLQSCDTSSGTAYRRIIYQPRDASAGTAPAPGVFLAGSMAKVAGNSGNMSRSDGQVFVGWADMSGNKYSVGKHFPINADLVLFAQWKSISPSRLAQKRSFWSTDLVDDSWYQVEAVPLYEGTHCIVYADIHAFLTIEESWGQTIAGEYDKPTNGIYDKITGVFTNTIKYEAGNKDNKVIFLLLDIQDGYAGSGGYVAGYFHSLHMYHPSTYLNSNRTAMLFMDIDPGLSDPNPANSKSRTFYSTMAHEFQHLINWSIRYNQYGTDIDNHLTETWLDEGLSTAAEYVYGGEDASRINYFNTDPNKTIIDGNNFFYWNIYGNTWDNDVLADYSTAYLFFRWLGIQSASGNTVFTDIINSANGNFQAVTGAAAAIATGIDPGASTDAGKQWAALLGGWMRANMTGSAAGYFGYKEQVTPAPRAKYYTGTKNSEFAFFPGEGVFSLGDKGGMTDSGNIKYIDNITGTSGNKVLLTYNGNTAVDGDIEKGFLANTAGTAGRGAASGMAVSGGGEEAALPASYPIGFRDLPGDRARTGGRSAGTGVKK
jgi:hypothetical protein